MTAAERKSDFKLTTNINFSKVYSPGETRETVLGEQLELNQFLLLMPKT